MPMVVFRKTRVHPSRLLRGLPCSKSLTAIQRSSRLEKKLVTPVRAKLGTTFLYPSATGLAIAWSKLSLKLNTARFMGSSGSRGFPDVAHPAHNVATRKIPIHRPKKRIARPVWLYSKVNLLLVIRTPAFGRFTIQELANQILQYHRRLRNLQGIPVFQVCSIATGGKADVLLTQQTRGQNFRRSVARELIPRIDHHRYRGLERFIVETHIIYATHHNSGTFHRCTGLKTADVIEFSLDLIRFRRRKRR